MEKPADFQLLPATDRPTAALSGDWTTRQLGGSAEALSQALSGLQGFVLDLTAVRRMDTAGAYAVVRAAGADFSLDRVVARPESKRLLELVDSAVRVEPVLRREPRGFVVCSAAISSVGFRPFRLRQAGTSIPEL